METITSYLETLKSPRKEQIESLHKLIQEWVPDLEIKLSPKNQMVCSFEMGKDEALSPPSQFESRRKRISPFAH